jgi:hypothetical protein
VTSVALEGPNWPRLPARALRRGAAIGECIQSRLASISTGLTGERASVAEAALPAAEIFAEVTGGELEGVEDVSGRDVLGGRAGL